MRLLAILLALALAAASAAWLVVGPPEAGIEPPASDPDAPAGPPEHPAPHPLRAAIGAAPEGAPSEERELEVAAAGERAVLARPPGDPLPLLSGEVLDEAGLGVPGASVACGRSTARTDGEGRFRLSIAWCTPETPLVASKRGVEAARIEGFAEALAGDPVEIHPVRLVLAAAERSPTRTAKRSRSAARGTGPRAPRAALFFDASGALDPPDEIVAADEEGRSVPVGGVSPRARLEGGRSASLRVREDVRWLHVLRRGRHLGQVPVPPGAPGAERFVSWP